MVATKKVDEKVWDMKVRSITKVEREKEDTDSVVYKMVARDKDGVNECVITSGSPFRGLTPKDGVIQIVIRNSQLIVKDFELPKKEEE